MSVEFAAKQINSKLRDGRPYHDTEEPNTAQIEAFNKTFWPYIQKNYPSVTFKGTSAEVAFDDQGNPARPGAHGDTYGLSEETLAKMGIKVE